MASYRVLLFVLALTSSCLSSERGDREIEGHNPETETLTFLKPNSVANLAALPYERLPRSVQRIVREVGDSSHWCCAVPTTQFITHSAAELRYHVASDKVTSYKGCGWWGWSRCKVYRTVYKHSTHYGSSYKSVEVPVSCPNHKVVCCKTYMMVAEHCLPISRLEEVKDDLIALQDMGEI